MVFVPIVVTFTPPPPTLRSAVSEPDGRTSGRDIPPPTRDETGVASESIDESPLVVQKYDVGDGVMSSKDASGAKPANDFGLGGCGNVADLRLIRFDFILHSETERWCTCFSDESFDGTGVSRKRPAASSPPSSPSPASRGSKRFV